MFNFLRKPEYNVVKILLLILVIIVLGIFIVFNIVRRTNFNGAQTIDIGGLIYDGAVLPSLLSSGLDNQIDSFYNVENQDFFNALNDTGLNMLRYLPGVNANYAHFDGWGEGFRANETDFWNGDGTKETEQNYTTKYTNIARFHDKFLNVIPHMRRPVATYSLNVVTQVADGMPLTAPIPTDPGSIQKMIDENIALLNDIRSNHPGVVLEGVQLCSECSVEAPSTTQGVQAFTSASHFVARVHPLALAIQAWAQTHNMPDLKIQIHVKKPKKDAQDYGASSSWNKCIKGDSTSSDPNCKIGFSDIVNIEYGTYLNGDDLVDYDNVCDPSQHPGIDIFDCFRDKSREFLDGKMQAALTSYTSYFGNHKFRVTQKEINNYDQSQLTSNFTAAAFNNTIANAAFEAEYLFKLAQFNHTHDNIIASASSTNLGGYSSHVLGKQKVAKSINPATKDQQIPDNEVYNSTGSYDSAPLKLYVSGLTYKLIKDVFSGHQKVIDLQSTVSGVPQGQFQVYGFEDILTSEKTYYFINWSDRVVPLSTIEINGEAISDPQATLSVSWIKGESLSSTYGIGDDRNPDAENMDLMVTDNLFDQITPITSCMIGESQATGTDCVSLAKYSITKIEGLGLATLADDTTPPSIPTNLATQSTTPSSATLSWDASTDDSGNVAEYTVYQIEGEDESGSTVGGGTNCVTSNGNDTGTLRYCNEIFAFSEVSKNTYQYATAPDGDNTELFLDLYLPPNESNERLPLAFNLHGGGGDKADSGWCKDFTMRGWACASINYRGEGGGNFNNANQILAGTDLAAAVRWARANAGVYNFDKNRIVATGTSAGGLTSFTADMLGNNMNNAAITSDARVSLSNMNEPSWICSAAGHPGGVTMTMLNTFLDVNDGPMHDYHGEDDHTLEYTSVKSAFDQIMAVIPSTFTHWPGTGHKVGHADEIIPDIFAKLYTDVIVGGCPQNYSNIAKILN